MTLGCIMTVFGWNDIAYYDNNWFFSLVYIKVMMHMYDVYFISESVETQLNIRRKISGPESVVEQRRKVDLPETDFRLTDLTGAVFKTDSCSCIWFHVGRISPPVCGKWVWKMESKSVKNNLKCWDSNYFQIDFSAIRFRFEPYFSM